MPTALERAWQFLTERECGERADPDLHAGTKTQFPGNIVPPARSVLWAPVSQHLPLSPTSTTVRSAAATTTFSIRTLPTHVREEYTYRLDFLITDKLRMYGRNNQINNNQTGYSIGVLPGPPWGLVEGFYNSRSETPSINLIYTITPSLINEVTFRRQSLG